MNVSVAVVEPLTPVLVNLIVADLLAATSDALTDPTTIERFCVLSVNFPATFGTTEYWLVSIVNKLSVVAVIV